MRWLLLDSFSFIDIDSGKAQAKKAISRSEAYFDDYLTSGRLCLRRLQLK